VRVARDRVVRGEEFVVRLEMIITRILISGGNPAEAEALLKTCHEVLSVFRKGLELNFWNETGDFGTKPNRPI
jgi:hypothetical protein